jgi:hypothetical protein
MTGTIDSFSSITSSYSTTFPHDSQTVGWAGYERRHREVPGQRILVESELSYPVAIQAPGEAGLPE